MRENTLRVLPEALGSVSPATVNGYHYYKWRFKLMKLERSVEQRNSQNSIIGKFIKLWVEGSLRCTIRGIPSALPDSEYRLVLPYRAVPPPVSPVEIPQPLGRSFYIGQSIKLVSFRCLLSTLSESS